jgi:hypothetical protein
MESLLSRVPTTRQAPARHTYDAELSALAAMVADEEMDAGVVRAIVADKVARLFGTLTVNADEDICNLVGEVVFIAMRAMREYGRTTAVAAE